MLLCMSFYNVLHIVSFKWMHYTWTFSENLHIPYNTHINTLSRLCSWFNLKTTICNASIHNLEKWKFTNSKITLKKQTRFEDLKTDLGCKDTVAMYQKSWSLSWEYDYMYIHVLYKKTLQFIIRRLSHSQPDTIHWFAGSLFLGIIKKSTEKCRYISWFLRKDSL